MNALLRKAIRDVTRRRVRSLLTLMGIIIGVAGLVAIVSTARNLVRAQAAIYRDASQADLTYGTWNASPGVVRALLEIPNVAAAETRATLATRWQVGGVWRDVYLIGVPDFGAITVNRLTVREGRYPGMGELMPEWSVRRLFPLQVGQEVLVRDRFGQQRVFTISGFAQSPAYLSATLTHLPILYAPAKQVRQLLGADGDNQILIRLHDYRLREETRQEIERLFRRRGLPFGQPLIRDPQHFVGKRELDALLRVLFLFSLLGLILSGFLVANTLGAMAAEQVNEIGIMKAVGGTRWQVLSAYLLAAGAYGLTGTPLGMVVGALAGWRLLAAIGELGNVRIGFQVAPEGLLLGLVVGLGTPLVAGLPAVWSGITIPVKEALESYGITASYGQGKADRLLRRVRGLPPMALMALRNLSRRQVRNAITLLVIAIATAGLLAAQATNASVNRAIEQIFRTYGADAWIWFSSNSVHLAGALRAVPEVEVAEAWALADAWVNFRRARLWGLPPNSQLYKPVLVSGRWFREGETDVAVVSSDLAADRGIRLGQLIRVEVGEQARDLRVVGIVVDNSIFLGATIAGKVFAPYDVVARLERRQGEADLFALRMRDRSPQGVQTALARLEQRFRRLRPVTESAHEDMEAAREPARLLTLALYAMVLLVGGVGALGVLNTLTMSVLERRREIGVLRAIGATDRALMVAFLTEGVSLGVMGWVVGLLIGGPVGWAFVQLLSQVLFRLDYLLTPAMVVQSLAFALVLTVVASLGPAWAAARFPTAEALRYE